MGFTHRRRHEPPAGASTQEEIRMPGGKSPGPSVKAPRVYEALRKEGMSKERAAKISNSQAAKSRK